MVKETDVLMIYLTRVRGFLYNLIVASANQAFSCSAFRGKVQKGTSHQGDGPTIAL